MESMHSTHSSSNLHNTRGGAASCIHRNGAHRSMTSLSSTDNVLSCSGDGRTVDGPSVQPADVLSDTANASGEGFMNDRSPNMQTKSQHPVDSAVVAGAHCNTDQTTSVQPGINGPSSLLEPPNANLIQLSPPTTPIKLPAEPKAVLNFTEELYDHSTSTAHENPVKEKQDVNQDSTTETVSPVTEDQDGLTLLKDSSEPVELGQSDTSTPGTSANSSIHVDVNDSADSETASTGETNAPRYVIEKKCMHIIGNISFCCGNYLTTDFIA